MATTEQRGAFRHALARARQTAGMSQRELGEAAEISDTSVSQYERGVYAPRREVCARLERALGLDEGVLGALLGYGAGAWPGGVDIAPEAAIESAAWIDGRVKGALLAALAAERAASADASM